MDQMSNVGWVSRDDELHDCFGDGWVRAWCVYVVGYVLPYLLGFTDEGAVKFACECRDDCVKASADIGFVVVGQ